nr:hypothetical protein [Tanacetum cinerariifolium]
LWKHIFSVGTTTLNVLCQHNYWNFSNLQDAFEESGMLHVANNVYLFSSVERVSLFYLLPVGCKCVCFWRAAYHEFTNELIKAEELSEHHKDG